MQVNITGTTMQTVHVELQPGETVFSQTHSLAWMTDNIQMSTNTGGGLLAGLKRSMGGGSFFVTNFSTDGRTPGKVVFASRFPGHVLPFTLKAGESLRCCKESFLLAESTVSISMAFQQRLGAAFFGGEGFVLQQVTGPGTVWLDLSGEVCAEEVHTGRNLLVHVGHVGVITSTIDFSIQRIGGVRNMFLGGDGIFLAKLGGPGKAWLQSMPIANLAASLVPYLPGRSSGAAESGVTGGVGGLLGNLLKG